MLPLKTKSLVSAALLVVVALSTFVAADVKCSACKPYFTNACKRGDSMDLRFMLDIFKGNIASGSPANAPPQKIYAFCPKVDKLQAFQLNKAGILMAYDNVTNALATNVTNSSHLKVYGMGSSSAPSVLTPTAACDSDVVVMERTEKCGGDYAMTTFLMLNVTMTNGLYERVAGFDQAVQVGFEPTCKEGKCTMGDGICIGKSADRQNCARWCLWMVAALRLQT